MGLIIDLALSFSGAFGGSPFLSRSVQQKISLVECKRLDDLFLLRFDAGLSGTILAVILLAIGLPLLFGGRNWWVTSPVWRRSVSAGAAFLIMTILFVVTPNVVLGVFPYGSIAPTYPQCMGRNFGAEGFIDGVIGSGAAAIGQPLYMVMLLFGAALIGAALVWALERLVRQFKGLRSMVRS